MPTRHAASHRWDNGYILLLGGARSGKSSAAVELATASGRPVVFIATATAGDDDMAHRISRHQAERPSEWATVDAPLELTAAVATQPADTMLIVDCITLWVSNLLFAGRSESAITEAADQLSSVLADRGGPSVVVSNEVGLGVVPEYELGRQYRDALGRANAALAAGAHRSAILIAGRALALHDLDEVLS
jgi:adenosylcobinamide kinase / adenosylcobinamide-phosphate guanylyltransferase